MRNDGPAIVARGFDDVDLIAPLGAMLMRPDLTGFRMDCHALHIAVTQGEFLGLASAVFTNGLSLGTRPSSCKRMIEPA